MYNANEGIKTRKTYLPAESGLIENYGGGGGIRTRVLEQSNNDILHA